MNEYERQAAEEVNRWLKQLRKSPSITASMAKRVQTKINHYIPQKVHDVMGDAIKHMVQGVIYGSQYFPKDSIQKAEQLEEADERVMNLIEVYQKGAAAEGAGTGAGGLILGAVDFPLLLGFKMRFLYSAASIYGLNLHDLNDRLYILYLFQAAFSSAEKRMETADTLEDWQEVEKEISKKTEFDWVSFQQEYRDHIDLVKMLQLVPGFGAVVGAFANYHLLGQLGEAAKQGCRLKWLKEKGLW